MAPRDTADSVLAGRATRNPALTMLRGALVAAAVAGLNAALIAAVAAGAAGVWGALLGLLMVIVFSGIGLLVLHAARRTSPTTQLAVALASYTGRIGIFGGLLAIALSSEWLDAHVDLTALGITAMVVAMAWTAGEVWAWSHARIPIYDLDENAAGQVAR